MGFDPKGSPHDALQKRINLSIEQAVEQGLMEITSTGRAQLTEKGLALHLEKIDAMNHTFKNWR